MCIVAGCVMVLLVSVIGVVVDVVCRWSLLLRVVLFSIFSLLVIVAVVVCVSCWR